MDLSKIDLSHLSQADREEASAIIYELERRKARKDPVFFIENYLKTFDPRPEAYPHHLDFTLYEYQKEYVRDTVKAIREGHDIFDEKSRDMGASWLALAVRFWMWIVDEGYQSLLGSRKEDYVDNGTLDSLFGKLDYFITNIKDPLILPKGFDIKKHRTYMKLVNPDNGNTIKGESSNRDFSRGGRYKDILLDEIGFWPDARNSWTAAGDATRCRHAVTTPPNEPSFAKTLRFSGKVRIRTWHWSLHPKKDEAWYEHEKSRRTDEEILHELDISWEYSSTGRPYPEIDAVPVGRYPYQSDLPLMVAMDLGLDALSLGYYQPEQHTDKIKLVEAFERSDHVIEWYFPFMGLDAYINTGKPCEQCYKMHEFTYTDAELDFAAKVEDWIPTIFFGDPSGNQRHIESGVSPYTILREHGVDVQVNDLENDWLNRRDETKRMMSRLIVNDTEGTRWWGECIKNAHYPKREETSQAVTPITKPVHDWTSHHRTQTEFFSVNFKRDWDLSRSYFVSPRAPEGAKVLTPYSGTSDGNIQIEPLDIGKILNGKGKRDWRGR